MEPTKLKRVLFVDDEPGILDGLRRMAHRHRTRWQADFAGSGAEALSILGAAPFDVVVTDMRMPVMDGAQLLEIVRDRYPSLIRIVLSGHFDVQATLRAASLAHQFLIKPSSAAKLHEAIERSTEMASILSDAKIRHAVSALGELPPMPQTCAALMRALDNPQSSMMDIAQIVQSDVAVSTKVLQLVSQSHSHIADPAVTIASAVDELGRDAIRYLVLSAGLFREFPHTRPVSGFSHEEFQRHSRLVASVAERLPVARAAEQHAATAGFLHDIGKLILASRFPETFEAVLQESARVSRPVHAVEEEQMATSHAQVGAYLLALWGLPTEIVSAVSRHHHPNWDGCAKSLTLVAAVSIADALVNESTTPGPAHHDSNLDQIPIPLVTRSLPAWRKMTAEMLNRAPAA